MTPRPIHRRLSFWLGLFVACFLAWAWWDGYRRGAGVAYTTGRGTTVIYLHGKGTSYLGWGPISYAPGFIWSYGPRLDAPVTHAVVISTGKVKHLRIPDAAVFSTYLALWSTALAWRSRRTLTASTTPA
jgi:hypothetical protein